MKTGYLLLFFIFFFQAAELNAQKYNHPGLIIHTKNIQDFRQKAIKENHELFSLSLQQANEFCERELIHFENAHNRYREIGDALPVLGLVYQVEGDKKYVETAERWISAMLETESWRGSQNLGRSSWITGFCFLYDWMYDVLDEDLKEQMIERLVKEAQIVMETASSTRALSNHLLIETTAVGITGLILPVENVKKQEFLNQADEWARYIIDHAPVDGSWGEGVQYWQYGTGYFLRFLEAARTSGFKNYYPGYEWLKKTGYFPIYFSLPGNLTKVVNFSDCGTNRYLPAFLFYLPASVYKNKHFQDFGEKVQSKKPHKFSWLDFLFYDASVPAADFMQLPLFKHFEDHGFVTMRSGWETGSSMVAFRCGPAPGHRNQKHPGRIIHRGFGPGHQQPDINSFIVFAQNEWLAIDPGYTHLKETRNHNTILVNGKGQAGAGGKWLDYMEFESREPAPKIIYAETNDKFDYLIGDAGNIYVDEAGLEYFRRHLVFLKPDIVVVLDDLKASENSTFEWNLQANEITQIEKVNRDFKLTKNDVEFWVNPVLPADVKTEVKERMLDANDVHGLPDHDEGILKTINLLKKATETRFLVVISINEKGNQKKPVINYENQELTIVTNGRKRKLKIMGNQPEPNLPLLKLVAR